MKFMKFNVGDKVFCELTDKELPPHLVGIMIETEIVMHDSEYGYAILVPQQLEDYIGWHFDPYDTGAYPKYKDRMGWWVGESGLTLMHSIMPSKVSGANCIKCNYHNEYAESNPNYICFNCR